MTTTTYENVLKNIYYDPSNPASFGSINKLYDKAKQNIPISKQFVKDWLIGENTYSLHKQARKRFSREKILVSGPNEQFQADLVDLQEFSRFNNGIKYILTVIDCFSKFAFAIPLKNKTGLEVKKAFEKVFAQKTPYVLQTDRGLEFKNRILQSYLKEKDVHYFTTFNSEFKCAIVERFNRTLKSKMFKYFTAKGTRKYIDVLPKLIESYNHSYHRTIKTYPSNVDEDNKNIVFHNIYGYSNVRDYLLSLNGKQVLHSGDTVRQKYELTPMDKGYYPNWTVIIFKVEKSIKGKSKPRYVLKDDKGNILPRRYYPEEIQKIKENLYRIEKIIKPQTRNGKKGFIVKWLGYSSDYNSWVPAEDIQDVTR